MRPSRLLAVVLGACAGPGGDEPPEARQVGPEPLADLDPDPLVFEADLYARATTWSTGERDVEGLAFNDQVPGPLIRVPLGARVKIHFHNELPDGLETTIHWHGIEANNASDGTHVTQMSVPVGGTFEYDFVVTRPGTYWYHPHERGAKGVFEGLYGPLIVDDPGEPQLQAMGRLPSEERVLVLSDVSLSAGRPWSVEVDNAMEIMNGTEGEYLLVNGQELPVVEIPAVGAVRLRLINTSITRFWRLAVPGHHLIRVGGEGGLLDAARVEGGVVTAAVSRITDGAALDPVQHELGSERGQIVLAPAERADIVLLTDGAPGDELELRWEDFARGRHGMWMEGEEMVMGDAEDDGLRPGAGVATLRLTAGAEGAPMDLAEGSPLLLELGRPTGRLPGDGALEWSGDAAMVLSEFMDMYQDDHQVWQMTTELYVDGLSWTPMHGGAHTPEAPTARHARLGQTIDWEIRNESMMTHPVHLHGFSYQPLYFRQVNVAADRVTTWTVDHDEFEDTTIIPGETSLFIRMRLDDPVGDGGAIGRWMRHCHILQHGENGMMSELVVDP